MHAITSQRVVVTGATGFIGRHLVRRLIDHQCEVTCVVRATSRVDELREMGATLATCDLAGRDSVERVVSECEPNVVFHVAGLVRSINRAAFANVNADGVTSIAAACAACAKPPVLIVVSSLAAAGPCIDDCPRTEADEASPVSAYGRSKFAGEQAALRFAGRVPTTIVRPPIVFGPGDHGVLQMLRPIHRWGVHVMPGQGAFRLSLVYVDDLIDGLIAAAADGERVRDDATGAGVYFMAVEEHPTYAELGQLFAAALGRRRVRLLSVPPPVLRLVSHVADGYGRVRGAPTWISSDKVTEALAGSWMCSSSKAREHLRWQATSSLADRLRETAQWHRDAGWL